MTHRTYFRNWEQPPHFARTCGTLRMSVARSGNTACSDIQRWNMSVGAKQCIYCEGRLVNIGDGEHVIPDALGGNLTIKTVCNDCNNKFSLLDNELLSHLLVRLVACREQPAKLLPVWDYDPSSDLAIESHMKNGEAVPFPQVILNDRQPEFHADYDDLRYNSFDAFRKFYLLLTRARQNPNPKRAPKWIWEPLVNAPRRGKFPPRIYSKHRIFDLTRSLHSFAVI